MKGRGQRPARRREPRVRLQLRPSVRDADSGEVLGELADISGHGLMLTSSAPLTLHRRYRMHVVLPGAAGSPLELSAEAAWSVHTLNPAGHRTGFRALAVERDGVRLLDRVIEACYAPAGGD